MVMRKNGRGKERRKAKELKERSKEGIRERKKEIREMK